MPVIVEALQASGAIVDVSLGWSRSRAIQLRRAFHPVPPPVAARAILDTGAEITCVDMALVQALGLPSGGTGLANVPAHGGVSLASMHDAGLSIVHPSGNPGFNLVVRDLTVLELNLGPIGYQVLVGRDVLARCRFLYNGQGNRFRLAY